MLDKGIWSFREDDVFDAGRALVEVQQILVMFWRLGISYPMKFSAENQPGLLAPLEVTP